MTGREKFIAAMRPMPCNYDERAEKFTDAGVNLAWFAWQASRNAALEDAAHVVGKEIENARLEHYYPGVVGMLEDASAAIRALANKKEG